MFGSFEYSCPEGGLHIHNRRRYHSKRRKISLLLHVMFQFVSASASKASKASQFRVHDNFGATAAVSFCSWFRGAALLNIATGRENII